MTPGPALSAALAGVGGRAVLGPQQCPIAGHGDPGAVLPNLPEPEAVVARVESLPPGGSVALNRWPARFCADCGIATTAISEEVRHRRTVGHRFLFNYGAEPAIKECIRLPAAGIHIAPRARIGGAR